MTTMFQLQKKTKSRLSEGWVVGLCVLLSATAVTAGTATNRCVRKDSPNPALPYDTWDNAAHDIQTAVNAAVAGNKDEVIVAPGVYDTGQAKESWLSLTNRVLINKAIVVRSRDNDPATTIIEGAWDPVTTNGPGAVRGVSLSVAGAKLIGFTVRNGATLTAPSGDTWGGGVNAHAEAMISNCVIVGNSAAGYAGGVFKGQIYDSLIVSNRSLSYGGGFHASTLNRCTVTRNSAFYGAGGSNPSATNCLFTYNSALNGGAVRGDNAAFSLNNCLMYGNLALGQGGGAVRGPISLYNCTIVGNKALGGASGGGVYQASLVVNCIIYFNTAELRPATESNISSVNALSITNSCSYPAISGWPVGNITSDPVFKANGSGFGLEHIAGDYHLRGDSPCINAGMNQAWTAATFDLDGIARAKDGLVDIGCYEFIPSGTVILVR